MLKQLRKFGHSHEGVAAIEFALLFPIFIVLFAGTIEFSNYILQIRRGQMAVDFTTDFISRDDDSDMSYIERKRISDIWSWVNPTARYATSARWGYNVEGYSRSYSSIEFEKTAAACINQIRCTYDVKPLWVTSDKTGWAKNPQLSTCKQTLVNNYVKVDPDKIPKGLAGRAPIVRSDFSFEYSPYVTFGFDIIPDQTLYVYAIRKVRNGTPIRVSTDEWVGKTFTKC